MAIRTSALELLLVCALALACVAVHQVNLRLESPEFLAHAPGDVGPLPDGKVVRVASLGFERLVADLFWLRTVYYLGDEASHEAGYPAAGRLAELVTDIDPGFTTAYVIMNSVLEMLKRSPDEAIALLEKGLRHSDYWRLYFLQGFNYFYHRQDYERAAWHMREAAKRGGPDYLPLLVSRLYVEAGSLDTAIAFVEVRLRNAETAEVRDMLEARLAKLLAARERGDDSGLRLNRQGAS